nr:MAG TPA: hypothetical protein [Crassvirales sp.]
MSPSSVRGNTILVPSCTTLYFFVNLFIIYFLSLL